MFATGLQKVVESAPRDCSEVADSVLKLVLPAARSDPTAALYCLRGVVAVVRRLGDTLTTDQYSGILDALLVQVRCCTRLVVTVRCWTEAPLTLTTTTNFLTLSTAQAVSC